MIFCVLKMDTMCCRCGSLSLMRLAKIVIQMTLALDDVDIR
jgi:hypothetical protein